MNHRTVAVFTGSRAEYGLLRPALEALDARDETEVRLLVGGAHLVGDPPTSAEIQAERAVHAVVEMQGAHSRGRLADAQAVARGIRGVAESLSAMKPDFLLVLGDRIEVLAAATAASLLGIRIAHVHGGDAASGVCDESTRHAVTKMSHLHFPATPRSAERILGMGESPESVFVVGSPAVDGIDQCPPMSDADWNKIGQPRFAVLQHPVGDSDDVEERRMKQIIDVVGQSGRTLVFSPNLDPGSDGIRKAIRESRLTPIEHLERPEFIGLLKRIDVLVGNSSSGLIECAALGRPALDIGDRQAGRERPDTAVHVDSLTGPALQHALQQALGLISDGADSRFGAGRSGQEIARTLATIPLASVPVRKCWFEPKSP